MNPNPDSGLGARAGRLSHPPVRKSRLCTEISVEREMVDTPVLALTATTLILGVACVLLWRALVVSRREGRRLAEQVVCLNRAQAARPSLRVTFEFNSTTRAALLHVTNDGQDASVWAQVSIEGALSQHADGDLRAVWRDEAESQVMLRHSQTRTLQLAHLDLSVFPYAQWEIYATRAEAAMSLRAMHTSMIGGNPDTHAPPLFIQVALATSPESATPPPHSTIALQSFEAVRLRPV